MLLARSVVHKHCVSNGASAGAGTLCDGQPPVAAATAARPASIVLEFVEHQRCEAQPGEEV